MKKMEMEIRALKHGQLFIKRDIKNIRDVAKITGWSKSTIEQDLNVRLKNINFELYEKVREKLNFNKAAKHIRGGEATRKKYKKEKN